MKMKLNMMLWLALIASLVNGQQTSRFPIKSTSVWRINYEYYCDGPPYSHQNGDEEYKYYIDGDTLVGTRLYFKIFKTGVLYLDSPFLISHKYMGAIRDSADKVFYIAKDENSEELLYDFSLTVGDSIWVKENRMKYKIEIADTLENGRKKFILYIISVQCGSADTYIEGIGWLGGLLEGNSCSGHPGVRGSYLVCYSEDNQIIYKTERTRCEEELDCNIPTTGNNELFRQWNPEIVLLSDGYLQIITNNGSTNKLEIEIVDMLGKLKIHKFIEPSETIDINGMDKGVYIVQLKNGQKMTTSRFVNR